ncbi:MAG: abortive infection family protein [Burkholderiales bacterium]|nr:abortive infection family protein [Burkholderiales bacterium]
MGQYSIGADNLAELANEPDVRNAFRRIAQVVGEVGQHVRFVSMELADTDGPGAVPPPTPLITSDVVERALRDAERLIAGEGATSGVDRVHTAFHGYLKAVATKAGLPVSEDAEIRTLYKLIREQHPAFQQARVQQTELDKILRSLASIVEALNPLRNQASVAHPNPQLLEEPEAMLVINSVRSLMHYINARTNG